MKLRWVKFMGKWQQAEECKYYMINNHIITKNDIEQIGKKVKGNKKL